MTGVKLIKLHILCLSLLIFYPFFFLKKDYYQSNMNIPQAYFPYQPKNYLPERNQRGKKMPL